MVVGGPVRTYFRRFTADYGASAGDCINHAISAPDSAVIGAIAGVGVCKRFSLCGEYLW
jgi:hypothetical protein